MWQAQAVKWADETAIEVWKGQSAFHLMAEFASDGLFYLTTEDAAYRHSLQTERRLNTDRIFQQLAELVSQSVSFKIILTNVRK